MYAKLKIINKLKQNIDETHSKQPKTRQKIQTSLWILKTSRKKSANQKLSKLLPNVCIFQKENHTLYCGHKNL
jgi:hypothetical protein